MARSLNSPKSLSSARWRLWFEYLCNLGRDLFFWKSSLGVSACCLKRWRSFIWTYEHVCTGSAPFSAVCSSLPCRHRKSRCKQLCQGWSFGTMSNEKLVCRAFRHSHLTMHRKHQKTAGNQSPNLKLLNVALQAWSREVCLSRRSATSPFEGLMLTYISTGMSTKSFSWIHHRRQLQSIKFHGTEVKVDKAIPIIQLITGPS